MQVWTTYYSTGKLAVWVAFWRWTTILALSFCFYGCVYSFSNKHVQRPSGIQTIVVEAIYDTSREVMPHERLWKHLQRAVVADGNLVLTDRSSADAILRVHMRDSLLQDIGDSVPNEPNETDPSVFEGELPPKPREFRKLTQAGHFKGTARLTSTLDVEVWHLQNNQLLFKRSYPIAASFKTFRAATNEQVTTTANEFLRFEEAVESRFDDQAEKISRRIIRDLLSP